MRGGTAAAKARGPELAIAGGGWGAAPSDGGRAVSADRYLLHGESDHGVGWKLGHLQGRWGERLNWCCGFVMASGGEILRSTCRVMCFAHFAVYSSSTYIHQSLSRVEFPFCFSVPCFSPYYRLRKEAEALRAKLTPQYLEWALIQAIGNNTKVGPTRPLGNM